MELGELVRACGARVSGGDALCVRVCDVTEDSRTVLPGSLFVARRGLKADGRKFVEDAVGAGAVAVLTDDASIAGSVRVPVAVVKDAAAAAGRVAEKFYGEPSKKLAVIAVTGTNGKTTTTYLVWQLLNAIGVRCGLIGTVEIDDGIALAPASMTTPPAIEISRTLSVMVENGCRAAVLEVSSHALDQHRADALKMDVGVFTNLTGDHLDYHKTMEAYGAAKARLFSMLDERGTAVVNADDPAAKKMVEGCRARMVRCGLKGKVEASAEVVSSSIDGMELKLRGAWGTATARVPLIGSYNVMNVLEAVAASHAAAGAGGLTVEQIEEALPMVKAPPGRLEPVSMQAARGGKRKGLPRVFVDFAHSDDALANVLTAVKGAMGEKGALCAVFGCGGDKDRTKRPRMGKVAAEIADRVVVTSDNPRTERPGGIVEEIVAGVPARMRSKVQVEVDRAAAIRTAVNRAAPGDVVVIAGKGHEREQIFADGNGKLVSVEFDDREVAGRVLAERGARAGAKRAKKRASAGA